MHCAGHSTDNDIPAVTTGLIKVCNDYLNTLSDAGIGLTCVPDMTPPINHCHGISTFSEIITVTRKAHSEVHHFLNVFSRESLVSLLLFFLSEDSARGSTYPKKLC